MKVTKNFSLLKMQIVYMICLSIFSVTYLQAQETVLSSGGNGSGSGGTVSFSIGQTAFYYNVGITGSENQGVQQPYEIFASAIHENPVSFSFSTYPNPTSDFITLTLDENTTLALESMNYELFDVQGKLIKNDKIIDFKTTIDFKEFVPGTYYLRISQNNNELQSFKIVKN
jgi:hypothetical protein